MQPPPVVDAPLLDDDEAVFAVPPWPPAPELLDEVPPAPELDETVDEASLVDEAPLPAGVSITLPQPSVMATSGPNPIHALVIGGAYRKYAAQSE